VPVRLRRASLGLTSAALLAGTLLAGCGADTDDGDTAGEPSSAEPTVGAPTPQSEAAAGWLAGRLEDGVMNTSYENPPGSGTWATMVDHGLTLDVYFALQGSADHADEREAVLDALEEQAGSYVGTGKDAYAGSLGKLVTALQVADRDPEQYAEGNLLDRLEGLVVTEDGDELGRASDTWAPSNEFGADYSNTIGQSWVVRALSGADSEAADEAVAFLLKQQCADGFYRVPMESSDHTCDGGTPEESAPSPDATAFAVLALLDVQEAGTEGVDTEVEASLDGAREWLLDAQADDGSFPDADSGEPNANSSGVAGEALLALGEEEAAAAAAEWLAEHQVGADAAGRLGRHEGAVAFDQSALDAAGSKGIARPVEYQWERATAQSVVALTALDSAAS
jgi:hypothetical protein